MDWEIDEILTYVPMYGCIPPSIRATDAQTAMWLFWTRILAWKRTSAIFLPGGPTFSWN